ncbi:MAG: hypothetical protein ACI4A5_08650 [Hominilimicola sp.]
MRVKPFKDIDTALRIYYTYPEIGNKEIKELFGVSNTRTLARYKKDVRQAQTERGVLTSQMHTVNTEVAYAVWGIDVIDLEKRRNKLRELGL